MTKLGLLIGCATLVCAPGVAFAVNCVASSNYVQFSQSQATNLLRGSLACYPTAAPYHNQEAHYTSGVLGDYKKGPAGPGVVDQTLTNIGNWSIDSTGKVTYTYTAGGTYNYVIFGFNVAIPANGSYDFCATTAGATPIRIRIVKNSTGPC